jgi:hypothetical protein
MRGQMTHPDSDVLAEFHAGLITGRSGARISAHLAVCERCATFCDELAGISTLLAAVPAPAMPDAVVQRLEGVLAAEAAQRHDSERTAGDSAHDRARSPRHRRGWDFRLVALRVLAPAAGVMLLAAGGYGLSRIGASSTSSQAQGSAASAAAVPAASTLPSTGAKSGSGAVPAIEAPARFGVVTSPTNYLRATLQQQLERELGRYGHGAGAARELASGPVKGCVLLVTAGIRPGTLVLVEKARYQGQRANVIVAVHGQHDTAWVTTPACSGSSDYILATTTLPGTSAP